MNNKKRLEQQIDLLYTKYQQATSLRQTRIIYAPIGTLNYAYSNIFESEYISIKRIRRANNKYLNRVLEDQSHRQNLFTDNFLKNKKYHEQFLGNILDEIVLYDNILTEKKEEPNSHIYSQSELEDILKEYYHGHNHNGFKTYQKLIEDHRLINVDTLLGTELIQCYGATYLDSYHHIPFVISTKFSNIKYLATIVHEIGHIEDSSRLVGNQELNYYEKSVYQEVNYLYREKEFYEFLIKNNIEKDHAKDSLNQQLDEMIFESLAIVLLSNLPDSYLKRDKYKKVSPAKIEKLYPNLTIRGIEFASDLFREIDMHEDLQYSYGQVLSSYFLENPDQYQWFKERKYGMFEPRLLDELGITSENVVKVLDKKHKNNR